MAGVVGLDWREFTFAEMRRMYLSRAKHDSRLAARVSWAMARFGGFGGKERKKLEPYHFDPMHEDGKGRKRGGVPLTGSMIRGIDLPTGKHVKKPVKETA